MVPVLLIDLRHLFPNEERETKPIKKAMPQVLPIADKLNLLLLFDLAEIFFRVEYKFKRKNEVTVTDVYVTDNAGMALVGITADESLEPISLRILCEDQNEREVGVVFPLIRQHETTPTSQTS